jgi:hypothetical protein
METRRLGDLGNEIIKGVEGNIEIEIEIEIEAK